MSNAIENRQKRIDNLVNIYGNPLPVATAMVDLEVAKSQSDDVKYNIEKEAREAAQAVKDRRRDESRAASKVVEAAQQVLNEARLAAAANHPLLGKKVTKMTRKPVSKHSSKYVDAPLYGIVEIRTAATVLPGNISSWDMPKIGEPFVRRLKNDGSPGLKIDKLSPHWSEVK